MTLTDIYWLRKASSEALLKLFKDSEQFAKLEFIKECLGAVKTMRRFTPLTDAVIRIFDDAGSVIEMHEQAGVSGAISLRPQDLVEFYLGSQKPLRLEPANDFR